MCDRSAEGPLAAFTPSALGFMQLPHPLVLAPRSSCAVFGQGKLNWDPPSPQWADPLCFTDLLAQTPSCRAAGDSKGQEANWG